MTVTFLMLLINQTPKWSLIKCRPVVMDGWLKLDCGTSRSSRVENERGTKRAANPVLSALCASVPLRLCKHFHQVRLQSLERKDDAAEGHAHALYCFFCQNHP